VEDEDRKGNGEPRERKGIHFTALLYCVDVQDLKTISNETKMVVMGLDSSLY
jgi:hypothetical protein